MSAPKKSKHARKTIGSTRRQFMVSIGGVLAGAFGLPLAPGMKEKDAAKEMLRNLVAPPTRVNKDGGVGYLLVWMEEKEGKQEVMYWNPDTPEEEAEAKRFYEASRRYEEGPVAVEARQGVVGKLRRAVKKLVFPPVKRSAAEEALLDAIRADVDNEATWLDYARWLEGRGNPQGEFIRVTWEIERTPEGSPARAALDERWGAMIERHSKQWLAPLAELGLQPVIGNDMYLPSLWLLKGMPTEVEIDKPGILPERADQFFDAGPTVTSISFACDRLDVPTLLKTPRLRQIRHLSIGNDIQTEEDLAALLDSPNLPHLRHLDLDYWGLGSAGVAALAASERLGQLKSLDLSGCSLDDDAAESLARSARSSRLTRLILYYNGLTPDGIRSLALSPHLQSLCELDVGDNHFGDEGAECLAGARFLPQLTWLNLEKCDIGPEGARALGKAQWLAMRYLKLDYNPLGVDGMTALLPALAKSSLKILNLNETRLRAAGIRQLATLPGLPVEELNLSRNKLGDVGVDALAAWINPPPIKKLELNENGIGDNGAKRLGASPFLAGITHLRLSNNPIRNEGAMALAASPHLNGIQELVMSDRLGKPGRAALCERFGEGVVQFY